MRWNAGHLVVSMNTMLFRRIANVSKLDESFIALFKSGTKPADWETTPPSKEELLRLLRQQIEDAQELFADRVDEPLAEPVQIRGTLMETVGDMIGFSVIHEGVHAIRASDLAKVIRYQPQR
jgi:hypothetical protein